MVIDEQLRYAGGGDGMSSWPIYDDGSEYDG